MGHGHASPSRCCSPRQRRGTTSPKNSAPSRVESRRWTGLRRILSICRSLVRRPLRARARDWKPEGERRMKFMVMVKANEDSEAGVLPSEELLTQMTRYNEELVKAGVL